MQNKHFQRAALAARALAACALLLPALAGAQAVKLTLGHGAAPDNPRHLASLKFAELVKTRSAGRIEVQVAPSAQLGDDAAMVTALRTGALGIGRQVQRARAFQVLDGPLGRELADKSAAKGMVVLGYWDNGIRHMTNSKRPLRSVDDLKGLKMRTPPDAVLVDIIQALGAEAQQIKFAELYVALQQGVVDGQENPLANFHASKLYEVQKHLTLTGHMFQMTPLIMGKRSWDRLPAADRTLLAEAAQEATAYQRQLAREADDKLLDDIRAKGVEVSTIDARAFAQATAKVQDKWLASPAGPYIAKVVKAAGAQ